MTSVIAGGLFNAIAFAGAGFIFSKLNKSGYEEEMRRHNKAMEQLDKAKNKWYEEVEWKNKMSERCEQLKEAKQDFDETNKDIENLAKVEHYRYQQKNYSEVNPEPTLDQFYEPSDEMKEYQHIVVAIIGAVTGAIATHFIAFI